MSEIDSSYRVTADELRQFIERIERLDAEKKDLAEQQKEVMAEAKGRGYDTKVMRKLITLRKRDQNDIAEEEAVLEMYKEALGMYWCGWPSQGQLNDFYISACDNCVYIFII
jgi:uncharacterized protein (UPF0335 family)